MYSFRKGQVLVVTRRSALIPKGRFELKESIPTPQGSYNFVFRNLKDGIPLKFGLHAVEESLDDFGSELYESEEDFKIESRKGISDKSKWAEREVSASIPESFPARQKSEGDVWKKTYLPELDNKVHTIKIEVKAAISSKIQNKYSLTLNQVRPIKYEVLVAVVSNLTGFKKDCIVYPPNEIVKRALIRKGQHTYDSIMVVNLICKPDDEEIYGCLFYELENRIKEAYLEGMKDKAVINFIEDRKKDYDILLEKNKKFASELGLISFDFLV